MSRSEEIREAKDMLKIVREAIREILRNGQAVVVDGIAYTRPTIFRLQNQQKELINRLGRLRGRRKMNTQVKMGGPYR